MSFRQHLPAGLTRERAHSRNRGTDVSPRGERPGTHARVSEERYGRGLRGERGLYARDWRGEGSAYSERVVGVGIGVEAADYGYRTRRLYAYAPSYNVAYTGGPYYDYAPDYEVAVNTGPYYTPGWNVAYAGPYYDYAPGIGIGIGPVGIGVGPAWGGSGEEIRKWSRRARLARPSFSSPLSRGGVSANTSDCRQRMALPEWVRRLANVFAT